MLGRLENTNSESSEGLKPLENRWRRVRDSNPQGR